MSWSFAEDVPGSTSIASILAFIARSGVEARSCSLTSSLGLISVFCTTPTARIMPPVVDKAIHFGSFVVTHHVFYTTKLSFALVNLKPLLPGHVLVSPLRKVPRVSELSHDEVSDLFLTVQRVSKMIERTFNASSLNIAIQDGVDAGQSVPHVHAHIIPRQQNDMGESGTDAIYDKMNGDEGDLGKHFRERQDGFPKPDVERRPRSDEELRKEAEWLAKEMDQVD